MLVVMRIAVVCVFMVVCVRCQDVDEEGAQLGRAQLTVPGGVRRSAGNATRDSQLLSLLAARRRQLLHARLATHVDTLATLAHRHNKTNTTFAHLEYRETNSSIVKRITLESPSDDSTPTIKLITSDGTKEVRQEIKPHEIKHLFVPKASPDVRSRTGFVNNRKLNKAAYAELGTEPTILYVPPEKLEGLDKEIELDPDEEFQVDESNHGLYLLNYSDTENVTQAPEVNVTATTIAAVKENTTIIETTTAASDISKETTTSTVKPEEEDKPEINTIANSTEINTKFENEKPKDNTTQFMSQEIYNHFRPMETELPVDDVGAFIYFGQKLGGQTINDNLTNSPSLSASTKSVNYIAAPLEQKRKFNSRYSATEKYKNTSTDEEEINEDMDVSVVKNVIEKNKIRNTVKGPAPARHVGLVNAYRKYPSTTPSTPKSLNIAQLNVTEPIVTNVTPGTIDRSKDSNQTNTTNSNNTAANFTPTNSTRDISNRTSSTATPRNFTRNYFNLRRRPARITVSPTETIVPNVTVNTTTTEKSSTVYTAVVTSVSITSSMKGQNKTDAAVKDATENMTSTIAPVLETKNATTEKAVTLTEPESTTPSTTVASTTISLPSSSSSPRTFRHRIRIRTTTTEGTLTGSPVLSALSSEPPKTSSRNEAVSKLSDRLPSLYQPSTSPPVNVTTRPKVRRRRPTTTTTTTTTPAPTLTPIIPITTPYSVPNLTKVPVIATTEAELKTFVVTSRTSTKSSSRPLFAPSNKTEPKINVTLQEGPASNEEVVIEAEKTYTASYVLAGLGFLPVAAIIVFVLRSITNKKTKEIDAEYEGYFDDGADIKKETAITPVARPPLQPPTKPDQKWEFPRNKLRLQTLLGQGNFGQVWKAEADDLSGHDGLTRLVAVKSIKETASQKEKQELLHEIYIMQKIGTHPNVVTLLACCTEQEPYLLIMEYVMCGKLLTYLRERRSRPDRFSGSGALTSRDLTVFAYCVARGMDYIASKGIVHRDLAARNVLVDHNKLCKIADFGMSRAAGAAARAPRGALPVRWMAPEALLYNVYSHHSDVWAFGILLWEIVTLGSTPYAAMSGREVLAAVTEGYRLERPPHCKPQLYRAMHACWHADPSQRPSFADLKGQLGELLDNEPAEGNYVDLESFYQESSVYSDPSAIIQDEHALSAEYDTQHRLFTELANGPSKFDNRAFNLRDEEMRNKFGIGTPRMGGFGIRDLPFGDRTFSDGEFNDRTFTDKNFNDTNFTERKDGKLSTSSFHRERERERENPIVSRNSFNGFPRIGTRDNHFQMSPDGRNKRVSEFECDI